MILSIVSVSALCAVEGIGCRVLFALCFGGVGVRVGDSGWFAVRAGVEGVDGVEDEGGGCGEKNVAGMDWISCWFLLLWELGE